VREQTERMRLPRFLWVPFELGRPFGVPHDAPFQRRVLRAALELVERTDGPIVLEDFPEDAPASEEEAVWACPITFAPQPSDEPELVQLTHDEIRRLAPWIDAGGRQPVNLNAGMTPTEIATYLGRVADGRDVSDVLDARPFVEVTRLACDDLRTWYLLAARRQPGRHTTTALEAWLWEQTALGRLLLAVAECLRDHHDPMVRAFVARALVPRAHRADRPPMTP